MLVAPLSGQSLGLQRAQVTNGIRQVSISLTLYFVFLNIDS